MLPAIKTIQDGISAWVKVCPPLENYYRRTLPFIHLVILATNGREDQDSILEDLIDGLACIKIGKEEEADYFLDKIGPLLVSFAKPHLQNHQFKMLKNAQLDGVELLIGNTREVLSSEKLFQFASRNNYYLFKREDVISLFRAYEEDRKEIFLPSMAEVCPAKAAGLKVKQVGYMIYFLIESRYFPDPSNLEFEEGDGKKAGIVKKFEYYRDRLFPQSSMSPKRIYEGFLEFKKTSQAVNLDDLRGIIGMLPCKKAKDMAQMEYGFRVTEGEN